MSNQPKPTPYPWDELHHKWQMAEISTEQAVGQLIVWGQEHEARVIVLERELEGMAHSLADLEARHQGVADRLS